jgi:hypothetical protein
MSTMDDERADMRESTTIVERAMLRERTKLSERANEIRERQGT